MVAPLRGTLAARASPRREAPGARRVGLLSRASEPGAHAIRAPVEREIDGLHLKVLPLDRIIVSKRATNRLKDTAVLPVLEATLLARESADS